MPKHTTVNDVNLIARKIAESSGYELVEVVIDRESAGKYLRSYIDKTEGITLDDCEYFHKQIQPRLESVDYDFLEVSSPGIDRPLKTDRDYERHRGDMVELRFYKALNGLKQVQGILVGRSDSQVTIETQDGNCSYPEKSIALVRPVIDMEGIDELEI